LHQVDINRAITVALIQSLAYRINNRLIINIRRPNSWLFRSARQLVRVNKLSSFGHCFREIVGGSMKPQVLLKFNVSDSVHKFASQKRVCFW